MPTKKAILERIDSINVFAEFGNDYGLKGKFVKFVTDHKTNDITVDEMVAQLFDGGYRINESKKEYVTKQLIKTFDVAPVRGAPIAKSKPETTSPKAKVPAPATTPAPARKQTSVSGSNPSKNAEPAPAAYQSVDIPDAFKLEVGLAEALGEKTSVTEKPVVIHVEQKPKQVASTPVPPVKKPVEQKPKAVLPPARTPVVAHLTAKSKEPAVKPAVPQQQAKATGHPGRTSTLSPGAKPSDEIKVLYFDKFPKPESKYMTPFARALMRLIKTDEDHPKKDAIKEIGSIFQVIDNAIAAVERSEKRMYAIADLVPHIAEELQLEKGVVLNTLKVAYGDKAPDKGKENEKPPQHREKAARVPDAGSKRQ